MADRSPRSRLAFRLERPRLTRRLSGNWKVAVISAPAGWGKTTLALQVARSRRALVCRLSPEDGDPDHLLGTLLGAGLAAAPPVGTRTARLFGARREFARDGGFLTASLLREWAAGRGSRIVLLDDVHLLASSRPALDWLGRVIERSGARIRFLITCRGEPPLALARLELSTGVVRLGAEDLRFTTEEQARLLSRGFGLRLDPRTSERLRDGIRGFAAGLVLAANHLLRTGSAPAALAREGRTADPAEAARQFLDEEVLARLPPKIRAALLRTAPLEQFHREDLILVLGEPRAEALLEAARRLDLFLEPSPREEPRFHPLFRALLLQRFRSDVPPSERRRTILRLARAWTRRGEAPRAVRLLGEHGELGAAERLFHRAAAGRVPGGTPEALGALAVDLHARLREGRREVYSPWLLFHRSVQASEARDYPQAIRLGREALRGFVSASDWHGAGRTFRFLGRVAIATGRPAEELRVARPLVRQVPPGRREVRVILACAEGELRLYSGEPRAARAALDPVQSLARHVPRVWRADLEIMRATVDYTEGNWSRYVAAVARWLPAIRHAGDAARVHALLLGLAEAHVYLGEEDRAGVYLDELRAIAPRTGGAGFPTLDAELRARAHSETGSFAAAEEAFREARRKADSEGAPVSHLRLDVWEGILHRRCGRLARAESLLARAEGGFGALEARAWLALACMEHALVRGLRGDTPGALRALADAARISRKHHDRRELARNALFEAAVRRRAGQDFGVALDRALRALDRERYLVLLRKEADITVPLLGDRRAGDSPLWGRAVASLPDPLREKVNGRMRPPAAPRGAPTAERRTSRPASAIRVRLLGGFEVLRDGVRVAFARRAAERLVGRLALRLGDSIPREALAESLWPGIPLEASRNRFDVTLHAARRALADEPDARGRGRALAMDAGLCRLDPARIEVDADLFERAAKACEPLLRQIGERPFGAGPVRPVSLAERAMLERAIVLDRGELLAGWPDVPWAEGDRERLRTRSARLRLAAGRLALADGHAASAHDSACLLLDRDAWNEEAHRLELAALIRLGARAAAERRHREFTARIVRELGVTPSPETVAFARELLENPASGRASTRKQVGSA